MSMNRSRSQGVGNSEGAAGENPDVCQHHVNNKVVMMLSPTSMAQCKFVWHI